MDIQNQVLRRMGVDDVNEQYPNERFRPRTQMDIDDPIPDEIFEAVQGKFLEQFGPEAFQSPDAVQKIYEEARRIYEMQKPRQQTMPDQ